MLGDFIVLVVLAVVVYGIGYALFTWIDYPPFDP